MRRKASFGILISTLVALNVYGQFQRLGFRPQSIVLSGAGASRSLEAFCFDEGMHPPPFAGAPYDHVVSGAGRASVFLPSGERLALDEALKRGVITASGKSSLEVDSGFAIDVRSNVPGTVKITFDTPTVLAPETRSEAISSRALAELGAARPDQDRIWDAEADTGALAALGLDARDSSEKEREAVRAFQRRAGLKDDGIFGDKTRAALDQEAERISRELFSLGNSDTDTPLDHRIARVQREEGIAPTGRYDAAFAQNLEGRRAFVRSLRALAQDNRLTLADLLSDPQRYPDVLTFARADERVAVLARRNGKMEHWLLQGEHVVRDRGEDTTESFERAALDLLAFASDDDHLLIGASQQRDHVYLAVGEDTSKAPTKDFAAFIDGHATKLDAMDEALANVDSTRSTPRFIVMRSPLDVGRPTNRVSVVDAGRFIAALQKNYGDRARFFLGTDVELSLENARAIPKVAGGKDVAAVRADGVRYNSSVEHIRPDLEAAGVRVINASGDAANPRPLTIFLGHKDDTYRAAVRKLASEGAFRDGIFVAASCGEPGEAAFNTEIIRASHARAVIYYPDRINPVAVESVLLEFASHVPRDANAEAEDFLAIWNKAIDAVAADSNDPAMKAEVVKLHQAVMQVSDFVAHRRETAA
jgi:hypothetical protein